MLNVRLAGDHLYGKQLFTWLWLVMSLIASFCSVLFPTRCLGGDLGLKSVSEGFPTYRIYPKYSDTLNVRTPSFFLKRHLFYVPYISGHVPYRVFLLSVNVRTPKNMSLISHKTSNFHYLNILYICSVYLRFRLV